NSRTHSNARPASGSSGRLSRKSGSDPDLVGVDAGFLDERSPLVDLGLEVLLQGRRGGALGRIGLGAELGEALAHTLVLERLLQRGDELVKRRLGCVFRRVEAVPDGDLGTLHSLLQ